MSDSDPRSLPHPSLVKYTKSLSSACCGRIVHSNTNLIAPGKEEDATKASYVYNVEDDHTTEICRDEVKMDPVQNSASMTLGVLHEAEPGGTKTIQPIISTTSAATTLTSLDSTGVYNLTLDGSVSWDRDEACLYMSSNKAFRFRYVESDGVSPSRLALEGLSNDTGEYRPKVEFLTD
jgi:hypothetical protein